MEKTPQIYVLIDPISEEIRYVGKTISKLSKRLSSHYRDKKSTHKTRWINLLKEKGLKPIIKSIELCDENNLNEREIYWISHFGKIYNLTNITEGGDGLPKGYKHSEETKLKIKKSSKINSGNFRKGCKTPNKKLAVENIKKVILVYNLEGIFIREIKGIKEAAKILGINKSNITDCLKNRLTHIREFRFYYYTKNYPLIINSILDQVIIKNRVVYEYENGVFTKEYSNAKEAVKILNIEYTMLNNILRGKTKKCRKYPNKFWIYK